MKVKIIKDEGSLKEGDILFWNENEKKYEITKTDSETNEVSSTSSTMYYSISEQGVLDNSDLFVFLTEEGEEISVEEELTEEEQEQAEDLLETIDEKDKEIEQLKKELEDLKKQIITDSSIPSVSYYHTWINRQPLYKEFCKPYFTYYW